MSRGRRSSSTISTMRRAAARALACILGAVGAHRGVARQAHAERLDHRMHGVGRRHAGAHARAHDRVLGHFGDRELGLGAEALADLARPHILDVDRLAVDLAGLLVAADHEDRRDVEPRGGHQVARRGLVAAGQADHPVEQRRLDLHLDVVGDDVAPGEDVAALPWLAPVMKSDRRGGAHFERNRRRRRGSPPSPSSRCHRGGHSRSPVRCEELTTAILGFSMSSLRQAERPPVGAAAGGVGGEERSLVIGWFSCRAR